MEDDLDESTDEYIESTDEDITEKDYDIESDDIYDELDDILKEEESSANESDSNYNGHISKEVDPKCSSHDEILIISKVDKCLHYDGISEKDITFIENNDLDETHINNNYSDNVKKVINEKNQSDKIKDKIVDEVDILEEKNDVKKDVIDNVIKEIPSVYDGSHGDAIPKDATFELVDEPPDEEDLIELPSKEEDFTIIQKSLFEPEEELIIIKPKRRIETIVQSFDTFFFDLENISDSSKFVQLSIEENVPLKSGLISMVGNLEGKDIGENYIEFYLDSKESPSEISGFPKDYIIDFGEIARKIYYRILSQPKESLESKSSTILKTSKIPFKETRVTLIRHVNNIIKESEQFEKYNRVKKDYDKMLKKYDDMKKTKKKETDINAMKQLLSKFETKLEQYESGYMKYLKAREWLQYNASNNFKIRNALFEYIKYKINIESAKKKGNAEPWTFVFQLIENWIENYSSYGKFEIMKARERKPLKQDTIFKVKYDPISDKTIVKESKYSKALRRAANENIKKFEKEYPEYFLKENFADTKKTLDRFAISDKYDEEKLPKVNQTFKSLKKSFKREEEEDLLLKSYLVYSIFIFAEKPLNKSEIGKRWKAMFTTLTPSSKKLITQMVENEKDFKMVKNEKYILKDETITALSRDVDFREFLNYIEQIIKEPSLNDEEVENEEELAEDQNNEIRKNKKEFLKLPIKTMRSVLDVAKNLNEKNIVSVQDSSGNVTIIPEEKTIVDDYQYRVKVGQSNIVDAGYGLFAADNFQTGELLAKYDGTIYTEKEFNLKYGENELAPYTVPLDLIYNNVEYRYYIDALNNKSLGRYANDYRGSQFVPNAAIIYEENSDIWDNSGPIPILQSVNVWLQSIQPISNEEEILLDYGEQFWKESEIIPEEELLEFKNQIISENISNYQKIENNSSYLAINLLRNLTKSKEKQLLQNKNLDLLIREAFILKRNGKQYDDLKIQNYIKNILKIVPNKDLTQLDKTTKKNAIELRNLYYSLAEYGLPENKKILGKRGYTQSEDFKQFEKFPPLNRMDIIMANFSIVKGLDFNSEMYKKNVEDIVERFNSIDKGSLVSSTDESWSIIN